MQKLILASQSPARLQLLKNIGVIPDFVIPADIDETPLKREDPQKYVVRLAIEKASEIHKTQKDSYIIAADSVAVCGRKILGKPIDTDDASRMLKMLSGRRHRLYTGFCIIAPDGTIRHRLVTTMVQFRRLHNDDITAYLQGDDWKNKCGAYGVQKDSGAFVKSINGSYSNVVGLPIVEVRNTLLGLGYEI